MYTFLHAADIHLDSPLHKLDTYEGAPTHLIRHAARAAFENLVTAAIDEQAAFVLISGDLYDGDWKDYNTGLYFISRMRRLRDAGILVFIVAGNHDAASRITKHLKLPDGVRIFPASAPETVIVENLQTAIHGQSFGTPAVTKNLAAAYPRPKPGYFNIGMLHTALTGRENHAPYAPCTVEALSSKGYDYWALGHIHKREIVKKNPFIVFPGNLQGRHIRETGEKGCMRVRVPDTGPAAVEFMPLDVIRWVELSVDLTGAVTGYDMIDRFSDALESSMDRHSGIPLVVRAVFSGSTRAHDALASDEARWKNEIRAAAADVSHETVWMEKIRFQTCAPADTVAPDFNAGPTEQLSEIIGNLRTDPDGLTALAADELSALAAKLPPELKHGDDPLDVFDPAWLEMILDQAHALLQTQLTKKETAE